MSCMNVVKEGGQVVRREFMVAKPDFKTLVGNRVETGAKYKCCIQKTFAKLSIWMFCVAHQSSLTLGSLSW